MRRHSFTVGTLGIFAPVAMLCLNPAATGGEITPVSQDRATNAFVIVPQCGGDASDGDAAEGFDPFQSQAEAVLECDVAFALASAGQQSQIDPSSLSASGSAASEAHADIPETIHAIADSLFSVTFELESENAFLMDGVISAASSGDPIVILAGALVSLIGPDDQTIFTHLVEPGPGGKGNSQIIGEGGVLEPGVYTLRAQATTVIDNDVPPDRSAQASFDLTFDVSIVGDLDGDGTVGVPDLLFLLGAWGPCPDPPQACPADLNGDGFVGILDLLILLANWGS
ncbi:MAG: hypothetical protein ACYS0G_06870 [Planctomycetota bacterium]|jgi:hypothetical protein